MSAGCGLVLSENSTSRQVVFFLILLLIIVFFLCLSLGFVIFFYYNENVFSKIILLTGALFLFSISFIIVETLLKRETVSQSRFPICHDMVEEFQICARCKGFYVGVAFFGVLLAIKSSIYMDLLKAIGPYPYAVLMCLILLSVPFHGALRRVEIIQSNRFLHIVGLIFGSSIYMVGNFVVYLFYGIS